MSEQYRNAFQTLVDRAPAPPTWEEVSVAAPRRIPTRGPLLAVATGVAVVAFIGAVAWLVPTRGGLAPAAAAVDHVQVRFTREVTAVCEGGTVSDSGGFDEATIDLYGPSADDRWRADVTFPDGSTQSFLYSGSPDRPDRVWQRPGPEPPLFGVLFRQVGCSYETPEGTTTWGLANPPFLTDRLPSQFLTTETRDPISGRRGDLVDYLTSVGASVRPGTWQGTPVTVYKTVTAYVDVVGRPSHGWSEWWVDPAGGRVVRTVDVGVHEGLGSWRTELAASSFATESPPVGFFEPEGMTLVRDLSEATAVAPAGPTTTSIPPLSEPLMDGALPIDPSELPTPEPATLAELRDGDRLFRIPAPGGRALFVRLRPGAPPLLFGTSCDVLTSVELPAGWEGVCAEGTEDGTRRTGVSTYREAVGG